MKPHSTPTASRAQAPVPVDVQVEIVENRRWVPGSLAVPEQALGLVLFAHGSGSSHKSARNTQVSEALQRAGCATLLFDLLTEEEASDRHNVFDIPLLGRRVEQAARWARGRDELRGLPLGLFGASTGAAAALYAAAELDRGVAAVVSRGGRPDLALPVLHLVRSPTLLIVGELDFEVLALNREAQARLRCENELVVIADATHLFEEPGTLAQAADRAGRWFVQHFRS